MLDAREAIQHQATNVQHPFQLTLTTDRTSILGANK